MTIDQWLQSSTELLQNHGINSARLDCSIIAEHTLSQTREWIAAHGDTCIKVSVLNSLELKIKKRLKHIPVAYIIGSKEFYGRSFQVDQDTLIPRPESEEIISQLLSLVDNNLVEADTLVADIGTGSGILAVTAKLELPRTTVIATDVSLSTLQVAEKNASHHGAHIQLYHVDLLDLPKAIDPTIILVNLPYVPESLITSEEIKFEPKLALFSGVNGLDLYERFWQQLINFENKPTYIITESLEAQHSEMSRLARLGCYRLFKNNDLIQIFRFDKKLILS